MVFDLLHLAGKVQDVDEAALVCVVHKIEEREHGLIGLAVAVIGKRCTLVGYAVVEGVRFNVAADT